MELGKLLTEGKGKRVYATDDPDQAIVYFKDGDFVVLSAWRNRTV